MIQTHEQWLNNFRERTKNQPTRKATLDDLTVILRNGHDADGNKVIDKYFNEGGVGNVTVELPSGEWRVYSA